VIVAVYPGDSAVLSKFNLMPRATAAAAAGDSLNPPASLSPRARPADSESVPRGLSHGPLRADSEAASVTRRLPGKPGCTSGMPGPVPGLHGGSVIMIGRR
jgi:hypothetical protein